MKKLSSGGDCAWPRGIFGHLGLRFAPSTRTFEASIVHAMEIASLPVRRAQWLNREIYDFRRTGVWPTINRWPAVSCGYPVRKERRKSRSALIANGRFTSTPAVRFAQIAVVPDGVANRSNQPFAFPISLEWASAFGNLTAMASAEI
jgi:hypothetical protein